MDSVTTSALTNLAPAEGPGEIGRIAHYRVLEVLGEGGMGVVFRAEDQKLQRTVALKVMRPELALREEPRGRFLREARAAAALRDDHVVVVHEVGEDQGAPYIAMECLSGEPLDRRLKRERCLPVPEAVRVAREVALGLAAAHAHGLIHRDVKPSNVWLEPTGRVKLLDFGLVLRLDDVRSTTPGVVLGTPAYMAPEQARGGADTRADLFSLGAVLYHMTTGAPPFRGSHALEILSALANDRPIDPASLNPAVPPALARLTLQLLEKDPARRPASAAQLATALTDLANTPGVSDEATREILPVQRSGRRWALWGGAAVVLLTGAAVILTAAALPWAWPPDTEPNPEGGLKPTFPSSKGDVAADKVEPDRAAADWVLKRGGTFRVAGDEEGEVNAAEKIPNQPFRIVGIELFNVRVGEDGLRPLSGLTGLERLSLHQVEGVDNVEVARLQGLVRLRELTLDTTDVGNAGMAHLRGMTRLQDLSLQLTKVGDDGLAALAELTSLRTLLLDGNENRVTDKGLEHLTGLVELETLGLGGTGVTSAGMAVLGQRGSLRELRLGGNEIDDDGVAKLKGLKRLFRLHLDRTRVTDRALAEIEGMQLVELYLDNTKVSDAGLERLHGAKDLRILDLKKTQVTAEGARKLAARLPDCHIRSDHGEFEPRK